VKDKPKMGNPAIYFDDLENTWYELVYCGSRPIKTSLGIHGHYNEDQAILLAKKNENDSQETSLMDPCSEETSKPIEDVENDPPSEGFFDYKEPPEKWIDIDG